MKKVTNSELLDILNRANDTSDLYIALKSLAFDIKDTTVEGETILHIFAQSKLMDNRESCRILEDLISDGVDVNRTNSQDQNFVVNIVTNKRSSVYGDKLLSSVFKNPEFDPQSVCLDGKPLFISLLQDSFSFSSTTTNKLLKTLIKNPKFNTAQRIDPDNNTLLQVLIGKNDDELNMIIQLLIKKGVNFYEKNALQETVFDTLFLNARTGNAFSLIEVMYLSDPSIFSIPLKDGSSWLPKLVTCFENQRNDTILKNILRAIFKKCVNLESINEIFKLVVDAFQTGKISSYNLDSKYAATFKLYREHLDVNYGYMVAYSSELFDYNKKSLIKCLNDIEPLDIKNFLNYIHEKIDPSSDQHRKVINVLLREFLIENFSIDDSDDEKIQLELMMHYGVEKPSIENDMMVLGHMFDLEKSLPTSDKHTVNPNNLSNDIIIAIFTQHFYSYLKDFQIKHSDQTEVLNKLKMLVIKTVRYYFLVNTKRYGEKTPSHNDLFSAIKNELSQPTNAFILSILRHQIDLENNCLNPGAGPKLSIDYLLTHLSELMKSLLPESIQSKMQKDMKKFFLDQSLNNFYQQYHHKNNFSLILLHLAFETSMPKEYIKGIYKKYIESQDRNEAFIFELMMYHFRCVNDHQNENTLDFSERLREFSFDYNPDLNEKTKFLHDYLFVEITNDALTIIQKSPQYQEVIGGYNLLHVAIVKDNINAVCKLSTLSKLLDDKCLSLVKSISVARKLVELGAKVSSTDTNNALNNAIRKDDHELVIFLLAQGAEPNHDSGYYAASCSVAVLRTLLQHYSGLFNSKSKSHKTAIAQAVSTGNVDSVNELLFYGANHNSRDGRGRSAMDIAQSKGLDNIVAVLEEHPLTEVANCRSDEFVYQSKPLPPMTLEELVDLYILQKNHHENENDFDYRDDFNQQYHQIMNSHGIEAIDVMAPAMFDGQPKIPFVLFKPKATNSNETFPLIIHTHGGPSVYMDKNSAHAEIAYYASHGYVIACPNYRGSTNHPDEAAKMSWKEWEKNSRNKHHIYGVEDVYTVATFMLTQKYIDSKRVTLRGGSFGSHINSHLLAEIKKGKYRNIFNGAHLSGGVRYPIPSQLPEDIPLLVSHGMSDSIAPFHSARFFMEKLLQRELAFELDGIERHMVQTFVSESGNHHLINPSLEASDKSSNSYQELKKYLEMSTSFMHGVNGKCRYSTTETYDQYKIVLGKRLHSSIKIEDELIRRVRSYKLIHDLPDFSQELPDVTQNKPVKL